MPQVFTYNEEVCFNSQREVRVFGRCPAWLMRQTEPAILETLSIYPIFSLLSLPSRLSYPFFFLFVKVEQYLYTNATFSFPGATAVHLSTNDTYARGTFVGEERIENLTRPCTLATVLYDDPLIASVSQRDFSLNGFEVCVCVW